VTLHKGQRGFELNTTGRTESGSQHIVAIQHSAKCARGNDLAHGSQCASPHTLPPHHTHPMPRVMPTVYGRFAAQSIYGYFDRGAVQQMKSTAPNSFGSVDRLGTVYAMGGDDRAAIELLRTTATVEQQTVLVSSPKGFPTGSGFREVRAGKLLVQDSWDKGLYNPSKVGGWGDTVSLRALPLYFTFNHASSQ
jgi:hypothetical protein